MGFLVAHILLVVGFALALRHSQSRGHDFFLMTGTNYATGLVVGIVWVAVAGSGSVATSTVLLGVVQGARFSLAVIAIYLLLVRTGVGITFVLLRLSVIVPTLASIIWFGERPDVPTLVGVALLLSSLPLLVGRGQRSNMDLQVWWYWPVVLGTLIVTGAGLIAAKAFVDIGEINELPEYVLATFATATGVALVTFAFRQRIQVDRSATAVQLVSGRRRSEPFLLGVVAGGINVGQLLLLLAALRDVPGTVVFPAQSAGSALLTVIAGYLIWHERHRLQALAGVGLAAGGLALVSL